MSRTTASRRTRPGARWLDAPFRSVSGAELLVAVAFLILSGAIVPLIRGITPGSQTDADPLAQAAVAAAYMAILALALPAIPAVLARIGRLHHITLLTALAGLSLLWSAAPDVTARRIVGLVCATVVGAYFGHRFDLRAQLRTLTVFGALAVSGSLAFVVLLPSRAIMTEDVAPVGAWRGMYVHKNTLGGLMVLTLVIYVLGAFERRRFASPATLVLVGGVVLLWRSWSVSAFALAATFAALIPLLRWLVKFRDDRPLLVLAWIGTMVLVVAWGIANSSAVLRSVDRGTNLTGRTDLWAEAVQRIGDRPLLGHGFGSFWLRDVRGPSSDIDAAIGWDPSHAHNGFLDLALDLGVVAVLLLIAGAAFAFHRALRLAVSDARPAAAWPALYLMFFVAVNITESMLLGPNDLHWALYVSAVVSGRKHLDRDTSPATAVTRQPRREPDPSATTR